MNAATLGLGGLALDAFGYEGNLTEDIGSGLSSVGSAISSGASAVWSAVTGW